MRIDIEALKNEASRLSPPDIIWFGEHKGENWRDLPKNYLCFLLKQMKSSIIRGKARDALNRRGDE